MQIVVNGLRLLRRIGQKAGPYLVLEMLLPGGTLFALLLFLVRRKESGIGRFAQRVVAAAMRMLAGAFDKRILIPIPITLVPQRSTTMRRES